MSFSTTARPWLQGASLFLTVAATIAIASAVAMGGGGPHNVLIVGNRASDDSLAVANAYRQARDIPQSNLCLLDIDATLFQEDQSIDWEVYLESVRGPIADFLARHPSPGTLNFVVLTLDLPLRVKLPEDNSARAATHRSLSSMLTLLPEEAPTAAVTNPYSRAGGGFSRWLSTAAAERRRPNFRLVTMLGGYTRADALSLISRSVAADGTSPKGHFYFVESQHAVGFREADEWLREQGFESTHLDDLSGVTNFKDVMGHFSGGAYSKLTWPQIQSSSIRPGALVDMLQSYGALSYNWRGFAFASHVPLGWWIRAGASGVHGATDEPYAHTFPTSGLMQIVLGSYISGCNLAESYWSGLRQLVWQNIVLGDALCAPYARRAEMSLVAHPEENGRILLSLKATLPQGREFGHAMLFVDGATVSNPKLIITPPAATTPSADGVAGQTSARLPTIYQWELAANDLTPGHHRARAVIFDNTAAAVESHATVDFDRLSGGRMLVLTSAAGGTEPAAAGDSLKFIARYEGDAAPQAILLKRGLETLGQFDRDGELQIETRPLGPGLHELQAVAVDADNRPLVVSQPKLLTLVEPLHVVDAWPGALSGTNARTVLIYNSSVPYEADELRTAAQFVQGERVIPATITVDDRVMVVAPRAALNPGQATLTVKLPQAPQRSRDFSQTIEIREDSRLMYTMPGDVHLRSTVAGRVTVAKGRVSVTAVRPAIVAVGPVDINEPLRPARWMMPAYEISATVTISPEVHKAGPAGHGAGLGVHYQDIENYAFVRVESERIAAYEIVGGKRREIAAWASSGSTTGNIPMSLTVIGRRVAVSIRGQRLGEFQLSEALQEGLPLLDFGAPRYVSAFNVEVRRPG